MTVMRLIPLLACIIAAVLFERPSAGQGAVPVAFLLKDLNTSPGGSANSSNPLIISTLADGRVVFVNTSGLWVSDGTTVGTVQLATGSSFGTTSVTGARQGARIGPAGQALAIVTTAANVSKLWVTDGTPTGTQLVLTFPAPPTGATQTLMKVDSQGGLGRAWIHLDNSTGPAQLWVTDGTAAGTIQIATPGADLNPPSPISEVHAATSGAYFLVKIPNNEHQIWFTDGSAAGTVMVHPNVLWFYVNLDHIMVKGDRVFFPDQDNLSSSNFRLSWSDRQPGTVHSGGIDFSAIVDSYTQMAFSGIAAGHVFFIYTETSSSPQQIIFAINETSFEEIAFAYFGAHVTAAAFAPTHAYFAFTSPDGTIATMYVSDGTQAGTTHFTLPANSSGAAVTAMAAVGEDCWFRLLDATGSSLLYRVTPTGQLTVLASAPGGGAFPAPITSSIGYVPGPGRIYFDGVIGTQGVELCISDGTTAGTRVVADLAVGTNGSFPDSFIKLAADTVVFRAATSASTLWRTDGTRAGTVPLLSSAGATVAASSLLFRGGNLAIFNGPSGHLWRTDGTPGGTYELSTASITNNIPYYWSGTPAIQPSVTTTSDGVSYFPAQATGDPDGLQIYRTDGTPQGTFKVTTHAGGLHLTEIHTPVSLGTQLFFSGGYNDPRFVSDGTTAGTHSYGSPTNTTYLLAATGFAGLALYERGSVLERTDGTVAGTFSLGTITFGSPRSRMALGDRVYFSLGTSPVQMFASDGTVAGTQVVAPLQMMDGVSLGSTGVLACRDAAVNNDMYLCAVENPGTVRTLGQYRVSAPSSGPGLMGATFFVDGGIAYYIGYESGVANSNGLYRTDGTLPGTRLVSRVSNVYFPANAPVPGAVVNGRLVYAGTDPSAGVELFAADLLAPADCDGNGRNDRDDIALGLVFDANHNGIPDSCECLADWSGGGLSTQDIFDFLSDWFALRADYNHSGATEVQDIFDFLNGWFAGC
jgi:ELWxxDGT repeat protein